MNDDIEIINIEWEGPLTHEKAYEQNGPRDYGLYQYYGDHPVYGRDALLYIGKAQDERFGRRLRQYKFQEWGVKIQIYLGRIIIKEGDRRPSSTKWGKMIDQAETLLIRACLPVQNSDKLNIPDKMDNAERDLVKLHILNWNFYGSLLPEVSGYRFTSFLWTPHHPIEERFS